MAPTVSSESHPAPTRSNSRFVGSAARNWNDVAVAIGATASVNITFDKVAFKESVVVEGDVRTIDRHATTLTTSFTSRELTQLPGSRNPDAILWVTPSLTFVRFEVGGNLPASPFTAYGITGLTAPTIEGINVTGMNQFAFALDYGAFAEVAVGVGAYGPEWPTPGVHLQFLAKSGGNAHHGMLFAAYEHQSWQTHNIDASQIALGAPPREANRLWHYHDVNADGGGFIKPDRVWWYASVRHHGRSARQVLFPVEPLENTNMSGTVKGTVALTDRQRLVVFAQRGISREPIRLGGFLFPNTTMNASRESTASQLGKGLVWKSEWNAVIRNNVFAEIRGGQFIASRAERPNGSSPRFEDRSLLQVFGGHRDWQEDRRNDQVNGALSYVTDGRLGRHHLKVGGEVMRMIDGERWNHAFPGDVLHERRAGNPFQVYLFEPSHARSGLWFYEAYASDSWQVHSRLTLNLGVRFERLHTFLPAQEHRAGRFNETAQLFSKVETLLAWNLTSPRLGASFDLTGDGRTIAKFYYGLYRLPPSTVYGFLANPNQPVWWRLYSWSDANNSRVWEPGEESGIPQRLGGEQITVVDPGLQLPYVREVMARVEREIRGGLNLSTTIVWRGERQQGSRQRASRAFEDFNVEGVVKDPGPDNRFGNADDGPEIRIRDIPVELINQSATIIKNLPNSNSDYLTWEFVARRRVRGRWSLMAWYSTTWSRDHANAYLGQTVRANAFPVTPNDFIQTDAQGRHRFRMWSARFLATYDGPWGIGVTPFLRIQSGQPFARTLSTRTNHGTISVLTEPVGTQRQDTVTLLDLKVEKEFLTRSSGRLTAYVEVFNALNANPEQQISWLTGAPFLRPLAIVPPRIARVGFRLDW